MNDIDETHSLNTIRNYSDGSFVNILCNYFYLAKMFIIKILKHSTYFFQISTKTVEVVFIFQWIYKLNCVINR